MKYISVEQMNEACDNEYKENYSHGGYCHEQSFRFGFQEGVEFAEQKLVDALVNKLVNKNFKDLLTNCKPLEGEFSKFVDDNFDNLISL
jgi:hypothetical protein